MKAKNLGLNSDRYGLNPLLLDRSCLASKIQNLTPLINKLDWITDNDAMFRAYWSYFASGCKRRHLEIGRRIEQNADFVQHIKDKKAASFLQLLTHNRPRSSSEMRTTDMSDNAAAETIYEELMACFRPKSSSDTVKRRKRVRLPPQFSAWQCEVDEALNALKETTNPYDIEQISQKLKRLKQLQLSHQPLPYPERLLKTKKYVNGKPKKNTSHTESGNGSLKPIESSAIILKKTKKFRKQFSAKEFKSKYPRKMLKVDQEADQLFPLKQSVKKKAKPKSKGYDKESHYEDKLPRKYAKNRDQVKVMDSIDNIMRNKAKQSKTELLRKFPSKLLDHRTVMDSTDEILYKQKFFRRYPKDSTDEGSRKMFKHRKHKESVVSIPGYKPKDREEDRNLRTFSKHRTRKEPIDSSREYKPPDQEEDIDDTDRNLSTFYKHRKRKSIDSTRGNKPKYQQDDIDSTGGNLRTYSKHRKRKESIDSTRGYKPKYQQEDIDSIDRNLRTFYKHRKRKEPIDSTQEYKSMDRKEHIDGTGGNLRTFSKHRKRKEPIDSTQEYRPEVREEDIDDTDRAGTFSKHRKDVNSLPMYKPINQKEVNYRTDIHFRKITTEDKTKANDINLPKIKEQFFRSDRYQLKKPIFAYSKMVLPIKSAKDLAKLKLRPKVKSEEQSGAELRTVMPKDNLIVQSKDKILKSGYSSPAISTNISKWDMYFEDASDHSFHTHKLLPKKRSRGLKYSADSPVDSMVDEFKMANHKLQSKYFKLYALDKDVIYNNPYGGRKRSKSRINMKAQSEIGTKRKLDRISSQISFGSNNYTQRRKLQSLVDDDNLLTLRKSQAAGLAKPTIPLEGDDDKDESSPLLISDLMAEFMKSRSMEMFFKHLNPGQMEVPGEHHPEQDKTPKSIKCKRDKKKTEATEVTVVKPKSEPRKPCNICAQLKRRRPIRMPSYMQQMERQHKNLELRSYYNQMMLRNCQLEKERKERERHFKECQLCPLLL